jgi:drug/metabolite transporter (DMT)-like permease
MIRIIGLVLLAVGVTLLIFGYNASQSFGEKVVEGFTGRFTDQTMAYLIGGIAAIVGGAALFAWGGRRVKA